MLLPIIHLVKSCLEERQYGLLKYYTMNREKACCKCNYSAHHGSGFNKYTSSFSILEAHSCCFYVTWDDFLHIKEIAKNMKKNVMNAEKYRQSITAKKKTHILVRDNYKVLKMDF